MESTKENGTTKNIKGVPNQKNQKDASSAIKIAMRNGYKRERAT
jgi:hypothetical protein